MGKCPPEVSALFHLYRRTYGHIGHMDMHLHIRACAHEEPRTKRPPVSMCPPLPYLLDLQTEPGWTYQAVSRGSHANRKGAGNRFADISARVLPHRNMRYGARERNFRLAV